MREKEIEEKKRKINNLYEEEESAFKVIKSFQKVRRKEELNRAIDLSFRSSHAFKINVPCFKLEIRPKVKISYFSGIPAECYQEQRIPIPELKIEKVLIPLINISDFLATKPLKLKTPDLPLFNIERATYHTIRYQYKIPGLKNQVEETALPSFIVEHPAYISPEIDQRIVLYSLREEQPRKLVSKSKKSTIKLEEDIGNFSFPEIILELDKRSYSRSLASIVSEGPTYIIVNKDENIHEFLLPILKVLYRIKAGGAPKVTHVSLEKGKPLEDILVVEGTFEKLVKSIYEQTKDTESNIEENVRKAMREMQYEKFRLILIPVSKGELEKVITELSSHASKYGKYVKSLVIYKCVKKDKIGPTLSGAFGFIKDPSQIISLSNAPALDKFLEKLEEIKRKIKDEVESPRIKVKRAERAYESSEHLLLKWFVLHHLIKHEKVMPENVEFEYNMGNIIPDIYVKDFQLAIEIETFFKEDGEDDVNEKLQKYRESSREVTEIWFVIPNPQALLFAKNLLKIETEWKKAGLNVKMYTLDLTGIGHKLIYGEKKEPGLIRLSDVIKWIIKQSSAINR